MTNPLTSSIKDYASALAERISDVTHLHDPQKVEELQQAMEVAFHRELSRLPSHGREDFLSAVAIELLKWLHGCGDAKHGLDDTELAQLAITIRRISDTVRHQIARAIHRHTTSPLDPHVAAVESAPPSTALLMSAFQQLDSRATEVLALLTDGKSVEEIADKIGIAPRTVYRSLRKIHDSVAHSIDHE